MHMLFFHCVDLHVTKKKKHIGGGCASIVTSNTKIAKLSSFGLQFRSTHPDLGIVSRDQRIRKSGERY